MKVALHGKMDRLRVITFTLADDDETFDHVVDKALILPHVRSITHRALMMQQSMICGLHGDRGGGAICSSSSLRAARDVLNERKDVRCAARDVALTSAHKELIESALQHWIQQVLVRSGSYQLVDGRYLDIEALDPTSGPLGRFEPAAAVRICSIELEDAAADGNITATATAAPAVSFDLFSEDLGASDARTAELSFVAGDMRTLSIRLDVQGCCCRQGTRGFDPLTLLCDDARAELAQSRRVLLNSDRFWHRYCDVYSEDGPRATARMLPDLRLVYLVAIHLDRPPAANSAAPDAPTTAEGHRRLWGEALGVWLPEDRLAPFMTVVDENAQWFTIPAACLYPAAAWRDVRQPSVLASLWRASRERLCATLGAHAPPLHGLRLEITALPSLVQSESLRAVGSLRVTAPHPGALEGTGYNMAAGGGDDATEPMPSAPAVSPTPVPAWAQQRLGGKRPHTPPPKATLPTSLKKAKATTPAAKQSPRDSSSRSPLPSPSPVLEAGASKGNSVGKPTSASASLPSALVSWKQPELKAKCKELGLRVGGNKGELISRLLDAGFDESECSTPPSRKPLAPAPDSTASPSFEMRFSTTQLKSVPIQPNPDPQSPPPTLHLPSPTVASSSSPLRPALPPTTPRPPQPLRTNPRVRFADQIVGEERIVSYADPNPFTTAPSYSPAALLPKRPRPMWPGDGPAQWIQSRRSLTPAALALVLAIVRKYGGGSGSLSISALNHIQRALGETEDMGPEEEKYLLSFDRGARGVARPRQLSAMGYAAFVLDWLQQSFQSGVDCLRKLNIHDEPRTT